jgi:hypothetical protein
MVQSQPRQVIHKILSQKYSIYTKTNKQTKRKKTGLVEGLKW